MSKIDPEVLYLILTKIAGQESFYNYDPATLPTGQPKGTITHRQLGEIYTRITGVQVSVRTNWNPHLDQLSALLKQCRLPSLSPLLLTAAEAEAKPNQRQGPELALGNLQAQKWPPFNALKTLFRHT